MNILICNDDGIKSNGLRELALKLKQNNNVLVVAPDHNCSAVSHSISISKSFSAKEDFSIKGVRAYSITGTPADCVKYARLMIKDFVPDIVIGGINKAHNIGTDIFYSGTVAIAMEGAFFGHIGFTFSAYNLGESNFKLFSEYAEKIINYLLPFSKKGDCWNINFPDNNLKIQGIKICELGIHPYSDHFEINDKNEYHLAGSPLTCIDEDKHTDVDWINKGYITITPLLFNRTDKNKIKEIENKCKM